MITLCLILDTGYFYGVKGMRENEQYAPFLSYAFKSFGFNKAQSMRVSLERVNQIFDLIQLLSLPLYALVLFCYPMRRRDNKLPLQGTTMRRRDNKLRILLAPGGASLKSSIWYPLRPFLRIENKLLKTETFKSILLLIGFKKLVSYAEKGS